MGGVGKTTLAKHIFNRLQHPQGDVIWVTVSQEFSVTTLQDKIARLIGLDFGGEDNEELRAARLHTKLSEMKNSVLILDDVWEYIDLLKVGCPISVECCRLIITTRSLEVCRQVCCQKVIQVKNLHHHEAWKLFNETLRNEIELDSSVEKIARSVAELCGGLPLAIVTVAASMRGERAIHTWRNAYAELTERVSGKDGMGDGEVYNVLKYSFDQLNRNRHSQSIEFNALQHCFLYCALYPEDKEITRWRLVREFISGGLLDERKTRSLQFNQGHSILDKLVNLCLLESCVDLGSVECVKMHDLVRSMALKICEGKYMVRAGYESLKKIPKEEEWAKDLEKVSFMSNRTRKIEEGMSPDCPKLSTLVLRDNIWLEFIPDSFFSRMQGLCTLDLCRTGITVLPNSVCAMKSLKALLLKSCWRLKDVPNLGEMTELRELNLSFTAIKAVPKGVGKLFNLKFLTMDAQKLKKLPRRLFLKLGKLQHLDLPFHMEVEVEKIANLELLVEFEGRVKNVNDFNSLITSWGSRVQDTCYIISVGSCDEYNNNNCITGGNYTRELFLSYCNLKDEVVLAEGIKQLTISVCEGLGICFVDGLERLKIEGCGGIEYILKKCQMATLKEIELFGLVDMKGLVEKGEIGTSAALSQPVFSSLTKLTIGCCNEMRIPLPGAPNLELIDISECEEIEEIFEDEGTGSLTLPKLKEVRLRVLPRLRKVRILSGVPSLEEIHIECCEEIGILLSGVPNLESICVSKCGEIEEMFGDEGSSSLTLPKYIKLQLEELPKLKNLCKGTAAIICNSIGFILIKECPRLMNKLPVLVDPAVPRRRPILVTPKELWESLKSDIPNLSIYHL